MLSSWSTILRVLLLLFTVQVVRADIDTTLYQGLVVQPCIRILNENGTVGCQAGVRSGILYEIQQQVDLDNFVETSSSNHYSVVLPITLMNKANLLALRRSGKLGGVIVVPPSTAEPWSPDSQCPNCDPTKYTWNPLGNSLLHESFDFPIVAIFPQNPRDEPSISYIQQALAHNKARSYDEFPLYSVEYDNLMAAGVNSITCMRETHTNVLEGDIRCDPIGGTSVWATPSFNVTTADNKNIIMLASQIDSMSFFPDLAVGAGTSIAGAVTELAVIEALTKSQTPLSSLPNTLLFTFFDAEVWSNAGSRRFAADIATFQCKSRQPSKNCYNRASNPTICTDPCTARTEFTRFDISQISAIIEFNQVLGSGLDLSGSSATFFIHSDTNSPTNDELANRLISSASSTAPVRLNSSDAGPMSVTIKKSSSLANKGLPPSSTAAFLKYRKIPHAVISDFDSTFTNKYYNSDLDNGTVWSDKNVNLLCTFAQGAAKAIYELASNGTAPGPEVAVNCSLVKELMHCFSRNNSCGLFNQSNIVLNAAAVSGSVRMASHYASVFSNLPNINADIALYPEFVMNYLSYLTSPVRVPNAPPIIFNTTSNMMLPSNNVFCNTTYNCNGLILFQTGVESSTRTPSLVCVQGECVVGAADYHAALPMGFTRDEAAGKISVTDPSQGLWTESRWSSSQVFRLFLVESRGSQVMKLLVGIGVTLTTLASVFGVRKLLNKRLKIE